MGGRGGEINIQRRRRRRKNNNNNKRAIRWGKIFVIEINSVEEEENSEFAEEELKILVKNFCIKAVGKNERRRIIKKSEMIGGAQHLILFFVAICIVAHAKPFHPHFPFPPPPPCGLPSYLSELPIDAQQKITEIWKNYKIGDKCYNEQGLTREIIETLPEEVQRKTRQFPLPPFLHGLPKEVTDKFDSIMKNRSISFEEKKKQIDSLAEKELTGEHLKKFRDFKEKMMKKEEEYKEKESKLSSAAKEANDKINELRKQKFEIIDSLAEDVKTELFDLWKSRPFGPKGLCAGPPRD